MKFCQECGSECKAANGQPAKFCGECGESLDGTAKSIAKENPTVVVGNFDDMTVASAFILEGGDDSALKMSGRSVAESAKGSGVGRIES